MDVSVITTTYNGLPFLSEAIQSVLDQVFADFEYIIVDDGSTDATAEVVADVRDPRLRYIKRERMGRAAALNLALQEAKCRYVANLDADDCMLPERLAQQKAFLDVNSDVGMVGSAYYLRRPDGSETVMTLPLTDADLRQHLFVGYPFVHSAVMYRREALVMAGGFNESLSCSIDYDACVRVAQRARLTNLPEPLVVRRVHQRNYFVRNISLGQYVSASSRIKWRYWKNSGRPLSVLPRLLASAALGGARKWIQGQGLC